MLPVILACFLLCWPLLSTGQQAVQNVNSDDNSATSVRLPKCGACSTLVDSFESGMRKTESGKLGGGDTNWEENNQRGGYRQSEVRLTEIQDDFLCRDIKRGREQCLENAEKWADIIERWWSDHFSTDQEEVSISLRQFLCINELAVCCPYDHYGPKCLPCHGMPEDGIPELCSGRGQCRGNGTRVGDGKCRCQAGYAGSVCEMCDEGFYESYRDKAKFQCSACHKSCQQSCSGPGPQACLACRQGYIMDTNHGCLDVDECLIKRDKSAGICGEKKFCVNTEGSFRCLQCDKSCASGCDGDGPDSCFECATGYHRAKPYGSEADTDDDNHPGFRAPCVADNAQRSPLDGDPIVISRTRYVTYAGLGIASGIIFMQRSVTLATILAALISIYVTFAEYYLMTHANYDDI